MNEPLSLRVAAATATAIAFGSLLGAPDARAQVDCDTRAPIIFVHGAQGSAREFEFQVPRFASNGFDPALIQPLEYDSPRIGQIFEETLDRIDALADQLREQSGCDQVNLVGHSLGTAVSQRYLGRPESAARIAAYVNADGRGGDALPGGVRTLSLSAGDARENPILITGATNVTVPGGLHIGAVSGTEAFVAMFQFFTGQRPATAEAVPAQTPRVPISGRAVISAANVGVEGARLSVFELDPSGARLLDVGGQERALARVEIPEDGSFGPIQVRRGTPVEFLLERPGQLPHSFIAEGFQTADSFVRLPTTDLSAEQRAQRSDVSASVAVRRSREFVAGGSVAPDLLMVNGQNVINPQTVRCCAVGAAPAVITLADAGDDGRANLAAATSGGGFRTGIDVVIDPRRGTLRLDFVPNGNQRLARTIQVQVAPASERRIDVLLNEPSVPQPR